MLGSLRCKRDTLRRAEAARTPSRDSKKEVASTAAPFEPRVSLMVQGSIWVYPSTIRCSGEQQVGRAGRAMLREEVQDSGEDLSLPSSILPVGSPPSPIKASMSYADDYTPTTAPASGAQRRRDQLGSVSRSASTSTLPNSPITTRSGRALGTIGGKTTGLGFSPYARRTARGQAAAVQDQRIEEASATAANQHGHVHGGLVSMVKGLPGRALGFLFRSGSKQNIARSQSVADLASSESSLEATGAPRGRGLPATLAPPRQNIPRTSSLSALALPPTSSRQPRSTHSTLVLNPPPQPRPAFQSRSRNASPALSSLSYANRSPSPTRNTLATSMSAFNFSGPASPSFGPRSPSYGLTSRSPFAARSPGPSSSTGHALFPYAASLPRSAAGSVTGSGSKRPHYSEAGSPPRSDAEFGRRGSPLNPGLGMGEERARKKMLVWDPKEGLISREQRERERERCVSSVGVEGNGADTLVSRDAQPLPKNEAERILEVLEGMGRTPLGEAKRGAVRVCSPFHPVGAPLTSLQPKQINVPTPSTTSRLSHSVSTPLSPYTRRANPRGGEAREGTGLSSVFRAREERRAKREQEDREEREERERERVAAEERRQRRREIEREFDEEEERERREGRQIEEDAPRRKTRSMVKEAAKGKGKALAPPLPASTRKSKGKGRARLDTEEEEDSRSTRDQDMESLPSRSTRQSKSPAPPPPAAEALSPPPLPAPAPKATAAPSSLRPGRAHNSRAHTTSAKVFSAREEDLPPVDEGELGKIKLPPMVFPANFSFGPAATTTAKKVEVETSKVESNGLMSRLGPAPSAAPAPAPAFSFASPPAPATTAPAPFSFAPTPVTAPASKPTAPTLTTSTSSDFFSKPSTTPTPSLFGTPSTSKPNFFGAALAEKPSAPSPPPPAAAAPFSFGAPAVKPLEKKEEAAKEVVANPFAAFGKPIAKIVEENGATLAPAPAAAPSFGGFGNGANGGMFGSKPAEVEVSRSLCGAGGDSDRFALQKKTTSTINGTSSPFDFKPTAPATSAPPSFSFGTTPATPQQIDKPSPFAFNAPSAPPAAAPAPSFGGFGAAPAIEDADEDSGMEDESSAPPTAVAPPAAAPTSFSFGAPAAAPPSANLFGGGATNGSGAGTFGGFGAAPATSVVPPSFGATSSGSSLFGTPAAATSFGGFGSAATSAATSPAPQSPALGAFNFGAPAPAAATSSAPFAFGSTSSAPPSNIFGGGASGSNLFGAAPGSGATTPTSTAPFAFGAAPPSNPFGAGGAQSAPMSTFGSTNGTASPFGASTPAASPFGAAPAAAGAFSFGAAPTASSAPFAFGTPTSAPPPTFGAPAPPAFGAAPTSGFAFGALAGGAQPAPFAFGAPAPASVPGSPAAGGMFNVGSGGGDESPGKGGRKIAGLRKRR